MNKYYVYILTNKSNSVLYTGVTNDLKRRVKEHISVLNKGFTYKYNVKKLVYFELYIDVSDAIKREKQIKSYSRIKKINLIESLNPQWLELFDGFQINIPKKNS